MTKVIPLIWLQIRVEAVLLCKACGDACIYTFPEKYTIANIACDQCGQKRLTKEMPRSGLF